MATRVAARPRYSRLYLRRLGLWLFLLSEGFLFSALLAARYYLLGLERPEGLNQPLGLAITAVLLASSLTAYRAEAAIARGHRSLFARNTLATVGLGLLFLAGVGVEWAQAFAHFPPGRRVGTIFFTLTGMHALHVASGVALLAGVYLHGRRGRYGPHDYWPVEGAVKYWHFVDVVWVFIYPTVYLVTG